MKKYWTKNKVLFIVIVALIAAIIPFIINWAYKTGGYVTVWDGSDLLAFYGNILTAAAAVLGVYYTLDYSKFKQTEYEKLRVKPYIHNDYSFCIPGKNHTMFSCQPNDIYILKYLSSGWIEKREGKLPDTVEKICKGEGSIEEDFFIKNTFYLDMTLKNVGADSAVKIKFDIDDNVLCRTFSLEKGESKRLMLVMYYGSINKNKAFNTTQNINITYENIYGNQSYKQGGSVTFQFNGDNEYSLYSIDEDFFENQIEINN